MYLTKFQEQAVGIKCCFDQWNPMLILSITHNLLFVSCLWNKTELKSKDLHQHQLCLLFACLIACVLSESFSFCTRLRHFPVCSMQYKNWAILISDLISRSSSLRHPCIHKSRKGIVRSVCRFYCRTSQLNYWYPLWSCGFFQLNYFAQFMLLVNFSRKK